MNVQDFAQALTVKFNETHRERFPMLPEVVMSVRPGRKFDKVMTGDAQRGETSIHCFVEKATGHVYKAAGLNAPAKGVRFATMEDALEVADLHGSYLYVR